MSVFNLAILEMSERSSNFWGPKSFLNYIEENNLSTNRRTDKVISVNSLEALDSTLRENHIMVLRLGQSDFVGTQFCLVKAINDLTSFFLINKSIFDSIERKTFISTTNYYKLYPFHLISSLSETALVNFAFASGLIDAALDLDETGISSPATGALTATFNLRPYSKLNNEVIHNNGQIQIDALFIAKQKGKQKLFVLEAKSVTGNKSLAKHKLVYPILAMAHNVPEDVEIVPIYLNVIKDNDGLHFMIAECFFPDPRKSLSGIDSLSLVESKHFVIPNKIM